MPGKQKIGELVRLCFPENGTLVPNHSLAVPDGEFKYIDGFYFRHFATKRPSYSFGDLALTDPSAQRAATIQCEEPCVFAIMHAKQYQRQISKIQ